MSYKCPACQRSSTEPGYCPLDGTKLEAAPPDDAPAQQAAITFDSTTAVRAVSAADKDGRLDAMETIRRRLSEYDHLIGETLDSRYYVERKIGEGGMGVVFAVKHAVIERPLAIKVLKRKVMRDKATVKRFIQEAQAASRIGHPNIIDVTDFGNTSDGTTYQVMELLDGTTLSKAIKTTAPFPLERVVRVGRQIARALAAAHDKGIVHRDLKPENVFLTEREGRPDFVKIMDFGIAKVQPIEGKTESGPRITQQGSVFGTPEYMAPEQAAGRSDTDHRVDIYALGTILYEMLVGVTPHKGNTTLRTIAMQMLDPITPPKQRRPDLEIPADLEAIVMKALEKKREDRYQSMGELQSALDQVLSAPAPGESIVLAAPTAAAPAAPAAPRRNKPATRPLHEPQFVDRTGPMSFDHVYDDEPVDLERRSRWPVLVAGIAMLLLGAGGAILLVMHVTNDEPVAGPQRDDAAAIATVGDAGAGERDAQLIAELPLPIDAGTRVTSPVQRDAGVATVVRPPGNRGAVTIEILTRPAEANVYVGLNYRGPSGVHLTERHGTKLKIECKTDRMKGSVEVVFDGKLTAVMCTATRDRFCVAGLKNPYDDCETDPNALP